MRPANRVVRLFENMGFEDRIWVAERLGLLPSQVSLSALTELTDEDRHELAQRIAERDSPEWQPHEDYADWLDEDEIEGAA